MTYQELCSFEVLYNAYLEARKNKRKKPGTAQYEANVLACTDKLSRKLITKTYEPSGFEVFFVYEPKKRKVQAPAFVDKVVLHAVTDNILYDALCRSFIRDNHASQKEKGTLDALVRLRGHMVEYYRTNHTAEGWVIKCDVHHFFASIDHDILKKKLKDVFIKRGVDMELYELLCVYIDKSEGLPLGYQTSQLFALMFLDEFDHFIKERKRCRYYGRYMDDFYVIVRTKKEAQSLLREIREYIADLKLELNEKTDIFPLRNGIDFLGFHSYLTETGAVVQKLRREKIERIKARIAYWRVAYPAGEITRDEIITSFRGWDASAAFGDSYTLRQKFADQVSEIIGEKIKARRKINSTKHVRQLRRIRQEKNIRRKRGEITPHIEWTPNPADYDDDSPPWM